jgi:hypothetical protein
MSNESSPRNHQEALEDLKRRAAVACPLSLDQLLRLKGAFRQNFWEILQAYLDLGRGLLDNQLKSQKTSWEETLFVRGQYRVYDMLQQLPLEIDYLIEAKKETT